MGLRGVNLGGWLLLETWITPSLFSDQAGKDEYSFSVHDARKGYAALRAHRNSFITKKDFAWLAHHGITGVRLPIGYWALESDAPYLSCQELLDRTFDWADELGMKVIIDLHGAPGSQNGLDHSGRIGRIEWLADENIGRTLQALEALAQRYAKRHSLWGIELVNEPGWDVPLRTLRTFYIDGYETVRKHCSNDVAVIISDAFRPRAWNGFMNEPMYTNVVLDMHLYQCFSSKDKALDMPGHLQKTSVEWSDLIEQSDKRVIIGEWSLGLDPRTFTGMSTAQQQEALATYADTQRRVFDNSAGWFFWTYKTETASGWNFRYLVDSGIMSVDQPPS